MAAWPGDVLLSVGSVELCFVRWEQTHTHTHALKTSTRKSEFVGDDVEWFWIGEDWFDAHRNRLYLSLGRMCACVCMCLGFLCMCVCLMPTQMGCKNGGKPRQRIDLSELLVRVVRIDRCDADKLAGAKKIAKSLMFDSSLPCNKLPSLLDVCQRNSLLNTFVEVRNKPISHGTHHVPTNLLYNKHICA